MILDLRGENLHSQRARDDCDEGVRSCREVVHLNISDALGRLRGGFAMLAIPENFFGGVVKRGV